MKNKLAVSILGLVFLFGFNVTSFSQPKCAGDKIFTEKSCAGDDLDAQEKELFKIVNEYRAKNNLSPVALSVPLSIVANRHLLDLIQNIKSLSHGWSNCPYDIKDRSTWNCLFESPKRLNVGYAGSGYENLYRNLNGSATPILALEAWKKSEMHNSLILNSGGWKDVKFDALGVAISGSYAALWFGSSRGVSAEIKNRKREEGLGISFEQATAGLTGAISIKKASSSLENEEWSGTSSDRSVAISFVGVKDDISRAEIAIRIKLEKDSQISSKNGNLLKIFLGNVASDWKARELWVESAMKELRKNPKQPQSINQGNKTIKVSIDKENFVSVTVKPFRKPVAVEIK